MVFVIGADHLVQYNGPVPGDLRNQFREYLVTTSRTRHIDCIAEEFSAEALHDVYHATRDTALEAAKQLGIRHVFCDPEEPDMRRLGIPFFADLIDLEKKRRGIHDAFILDHTVRKNVREEAIALSKSYWHIRESFWYDRIEPFMDSNLLFVCGHEHALRFGSLVRSMGHPCEILDSFWREDVFRDYRNINLD